MPLTINLEKLWDQRYNDLSVPFPVDGTTAVDNQSGAIGPSQIDATQPPFNAKGDERLGANGSMTSGSNILTGSGFTSADVGKTVTVWVTRKITDLAWNSGTTVTSNTANFTSADVGKLVDPWGGPQTTIASVESTTSCTLVATPGAAVSLAASTTEISAGLISTVSSYISPTQVHLAANWTQTASISSANYSVATDDTAAFTAAIAACAAAGGGTVTAPAKVYRLQQVFVPTDVLVEFPAGTTIKMAKYTVTSPGLFRLATTTSVDSTQSARSGIRGRGGFVTLDMSDLQPASSAIRGIYVQNATGFLVENIRGVGLPASSGNVVHLAATSGLTMPTDGVVRRIRNEQVRHTGNSCIQVDAVVGLRVDTLWCDGGGALRLESGQHDGDLTENVSASRIRAGGESGYANAAIITNAHQNLIRNVTVDGFRAVGGANGHTANYGPAGSSKPNSNAVPLDRIAVRGGLVEGGGSGVYPGAPYDSGTQNIVTDQCTWQDIKVIGAKNEGFKSSGGTYIACTSQAGLAAGWTGGNQADGVANPQNANPPAGIITRLYGCVANGNTTYGYDCREQQLWELYGCVAFDPAYAATTGSNLLSDATTDVETGLGGWVTITNSTVTQSTDVANTGTHSVKIVSTAAGTAESRTAQGTSGIAVVAAKIYRISCYVRASSTAADCYISLRWYNSAGTFISQQAGPTVTDSSSVWTLATAVLQAPTGAAFASFKVSVATTGSSEVHYTDNHQMFLTTGTVAPAQLYGLFAETGQTVNQFGGDYSRNGIAATIGTGTINTGGGGGGGTPSGTAGGDLTGTYPNPAIAPEAVTPTKIEPSATDGFVLTTSGGSTVWAASGTPPLNVEWAPSTSYVTGQLVSHSSVLYQVSTNFTSPGSFNTTNLTQISVAPATFTIENSLPFAQAGAATIGVSGTWRAPVAGTINRVNLSCTGAPVGSALTVQFRLNGTSFHTLTIAAGSTAPTSATPGQAYIAGDLIDVNATSVGSGTPAQNAVAQVDYQQVIA